MMGRNRHRNILGLLPVAAPPRSSLGRNLELFDPTHGASKQEEKVEQLWREQTLVIDGLSDEAMFGIEKVADIVQHTADRFVEVAIYTDTLRQEAAATSYQAAVDEFCLRALQNLARQTLAIGEVAAFSIGEVVRSPLTPPAEPERRGFFRRLLGG